MTQRQIFSALSWLDVMKVCPQNIQKYDKDLCDVHNIVALFFQKQGGISMTMLIWDILLNILGHPILSIC